VSLVWHLGLNDDENDVVPSIRDTDNRELWCHNSNFNLQGNGKAMKPVWNLMLCLSVHTNRHLNSRACPCHVLTFSSRIYDFYLRCSSLWGHWRCSRGTSLALEGGHEAAASDALAGHYKVHWIEVLRGPKNLRDLEHLLQPSDYPKASSFGMISNQL